MSCSPQQMRASPRRSAHKTLGALGVQVYTNLARKPLDRLEFQTFLDKMSELGVPVWMHPARGAETPDSIAEDNRSAKSAARSAVL